MARPSSSRPSAEAFRASTVPSVLAHPVSSPRESDSTIGLSSTAERSAADIFMPALRPTRPLLSQERAPTKGRFVSGWFEKEPCHERIARTDRVDRPVELG